MYAPIAGVTGLGENHSKFHFAWVWKGQKGSTLPPVVRHKLDERVPFRHSPFCREHRLPEPWARTAQALLCWDQLTRVSPLSPLSSFSLTQGVPEDWKGPAEFGSCVQFQWLPRYIFFSSPGPSWPADSVPTLLRALGLAPPRVAEGAISWTGRGGVCLCGHPEPYFHPPATP